MHRTITLASVLVPLFWTAADAANANREKTRQAAKPSQTRTAVVKPPQQPQRAGEDPMDCVRAEAADPSGHFWGHRCWARAALGGTQEP
jgi:hypothetical protein